MTSRPSRPVSQLSPRSPRSTDLPEEYKKKAEIAKAEYRVDHLKHYIVTGRDIDWKQLKADSKLIKEVYDKK